MRRRVCFRLKIQVRSSFPPPHRQAPRNGAFRNPRLRQNVRVAAMCPPHCSVSPRLHPQPAQTALLSVRAWEASARQLQNPLSSAAAEISAQQIQYPLTTCRSLANVLPAAVGATLVGAVAYCELLPQCFCLPPSAASRHRSAVCVQLPWRLRSPRRTSLVPTRTRQRRRRRRSCADTPLVTTLSCPTVRRLPPRT